MEEGCFVCPLGSPVSPLKFRGSISEQEGKPILRNSGQLLPQALDLLVTRGCRHIYGRSFHHHKDKTQLRGRTEKVNRELYT